MQSQVNFLLNKKLDLQKQNFETKGKDFNHTSKILNKNENKNTRLTSKRKSCK